MRTNSAMARAAFIPILWIFILFAVCIPMGIVFDLLIFSSEGFTGFFIGLSLPILGVLFFVIFYLVFGFQESTKGKVWAPSFWELIDNGIRFRMENPKFDRMFAWHEFSKLGYFTPLGIARFVPDRKRFKDLDNSEFHVREFWISLKRSEYNQIKNVYEKAMDSD